MNNLLLKQVKVFCIEDDSLNRMVVQRILENSGAVVKFNAFGFAETIVPTLLIFRPNIILMDLMLVQGITGYELTASIQREPRLAKVPIVAVSSSDPAIEIPKAQGARMSGFIPKPISAETFPLYISQVLQGGQLWIN